MNNDSGVPNPNGTGNLPNTNPNQPIVNPGGVKPEDLMSEIQSRLLGSSGAISSSSSKIEDMITGAISKTQEANDASKKATASAFDREIGFASDKAAIKETGYLEGQRGFAQNTAALRDLRTTNEKSIRDLVQRKEEVMLQGDVATASKISDLILKKYEFEQDANQKVFSNLISISNFAMQRAQEDRLEKSQTFTEDSAKANIALKYGIEVKPGESLADVVKKAAPFATAEQKLEIKKMEADIAFTQTNTKKALADAVASGKKIESDPTYTDNDMGVFIKNLQNAGKTPDEIKSEILKLKINPTQRQNAYNLTDTMTAKSTSSSNSSSRYGSPGTFNSPLLNFGVSVGNKVGSFDKMITDFIFGADSKYTIKK